MASNNIKKLTPPLKKPKLNRSEWIIKLEDLCNIENIQKSSNSLIDIDFLLDKYNLMINIYGER